MEQYKLIDGVLYKAMDSTNIKEQIAALRSKVQPYFSGIAEAKKSIAQYEEQMRSYESKVAVLIASSGIDTAIVKMVDPEAAKAMGF